jgi:1-acyl-sn-glycerol-3-phosphate acyltransferase
MSIFVAVWRSSAALLVTLASLAGVVLGNLIPRRWGRWRWIRAVYRLWGSTLLRILKVELEVRGEPPRTPFLLVTNHLSYLDIFALSSLADCTFVAKAEIRGWPVMGWACRAVDTVFVDRERRRDVVRVGRHMMGVLEQNRGLVLFAEGTTSRGETILPFRSSLLATAAAQDLPVHFATLSYRTPPGEAPACDAVCWWGDSALAPHFLSLARLPRIYATVTFGAEPIQAGDRKSLAHNLHQAMLESFIPVTVPEEPCTP